MSCGRGGDRAGLILGQLPTLTLQRRRYVLPQESHRWLELGVRNLWGWGGTYLKCERVRPGNWLT